MDILMGANSVFDRLGTTPYPINIDKKRNRLSCPYLDAGELPSQIFHHPMKKPKPAPSPPANVLQVEEKEKVPCKYWIQGNCCYGDKCRYLHRCYTGRGFSLVSQLPAHNNPITAIAFPRIGSSDNNNNNNNKVYSGSKDGTVRVWDCQSGECVAVVNLGAEIGCMMSEGPWVFVGIPYSVISWNTHTNTHLNLTVTPVGGQLHSLAISNDMLFAGTQDGSISTWLLQKEEDPNSISFHPITSLKGHKSAVVSLIVSLVDQITNRLYSGSMDTTIRVWDLLTMQCVQILSQHASGVMSLLCWDEYLISCSLDQTIKIWGGTAERRVEMVYSSNEQHGVLALCGILDFQDKPLLMCSSDDNVLHLYDLPTFEVRGKIFSNKEIKAIGIGSGGLFFTGDGTGLLSVWKLSDQASDL